MIMIQIGVIGLLLLILAVIYQDEYRKRRLARKSAKVNTFWNRNKDRRKTPRINTEIDVLYEVLSGNAAGKQNSRSRDISMGGIGLTLNEKLFPGTVLSLQLNMAQSHRTIFTQGEIAWVKEASKKNIAQKGQRLFDAGVKFTKIGPKDEAALNNFINQRAKNTQGGR
ncbi:MAG: PilZ domain-containing protein [Candidatus Omnitrophica bacterium]|nr:PilZ domain-containing protein [Candidatus Omnitrophota bacterium]